MCHHQNDSALQSPQILLDIAYRCGELRERCLFLTENFTLLLRIKQLPPLFLMPAGCPLPLIRVSLCCHQPSELLKTLLCSVNPELLPGLAYGRRYQLGPAPEIHPSFHAQIDRQSFLQGLCLLIMVWQCRYSKRIFSIYHSQKARILR